MNLASFGVRRADLVLAYFLLRAALGINILMHGVARLLSGTAVFAAALSRTFHDTPLPQPALLAFGLSLPWVEALIGLLLLAGFFTRWALIAGSVLMLVLTFGSTLHQDWNIAAIQLAYAVVYAALLAFNGVDTCSLDMLLKRRQRRSDSPTV